MYVLVPYIVRALVQSYVHCRGRVPLRMYQGNRTEDILQLFSSVFLRNSPHSKVAQDLLERCSLDPAQRV